MKLYGALRKTIRHFGISVIEEKELMSFPADCKAFNGFPAVKEAETHCRRRLRKKCMPCRRQERHGVPALCR